MDVGKLRGILEEHKQDHLLKYWDDLDNKEKMALYADLVKVYFFKCSILCFFWDISFPT